MYRYLGREPGICIHLLEHCGKVLDVVHARPCALPQAVLKLVGLEHRLNVRIVVIDYSSDLGKG